MIVMKMKGVYGEVYEIGYSEMVYFVCSAAIYIAL
jgi:hypothetical protein